MSYEKDLPYDWRSDRAGMLQETQALREKVERLEAEHRGYRNVLGIRGEELRMACERLSEAQKEIERLAGYVEKLKIDISGHKGVIEHQLEHIHALLLERDQAISERDALKGEGDELAKALRIALSEGTHWRQQSDALKAELENWKADHHKLGSWPNCKRCLQFFRDDENAAAFHGRVLDALALPEAATDLDVFTRIELLKALRTEAIQQRDSAQMALGEMRGVLILAEEWMSDEGCDCGTDEPETCALCMTRKALTPRPEPQPKEVDSRDINRNGLIQPEQEKE